MNNVWKIRRDESKKRKLHVRICRTCSLYDIEWKKRKTYRDSHYGNKLSTRNDKR
jgi:hypothetical protein